MIKYKILGFTLVIFIIIWGISMVGIDPGFPRAMYATNDIDSIIVKRADRIVSLKAQDSIASIVSILGKSKKLSGIDRPNINTSSYRIFFYTKHQKEDFDISVVSNVFHGKMVIYLNSYYRADSIDLYINSKIK